MTDEVPGPELENRVAVFLDVTEDSWACRNCIAETLHVTLREVKITLLRLAQSRGKNYIETGCEPCVGCGMVTAVVRRGGRLRRIA